MLVKQVAKRRELRFAVGQLVGSERASRTEPDDTRYRLRTRT